MNHTVAANVHALSKYNKIGVQTGIEDASPYRIIQMLLDGALSRIAMAKTSLSRGQIAHKGESVGRAISIIGGLRDSLDFKVGGDIAKNLDSLYEYMTYRLMEANYKNDPDMLDEVYQLLAEIKSGWDGIGGMAATAKMPPAASTASTAG